MAPRQIEVDEFLHLSVNLPVLDVRSPSEYKQAHIPGAISFPLFADEERAIVGTLYKQTGREAAIKKGLEYFGPKLIGFLREAERIVQERSYVYGESDKPVGILVHCWRGGMRSAAIAWLLDLYGYSVMTLTGGYKAYRHWVLEQFTKQWKIRCLGGYTGSGKTEVLASLEYKGQRVIDLEKIARHKGSAFGGIGQSQEQPTQEMFENHLAFELNQVVLKAKSLIEYETIWLEDESQRIGTVNIPQALWEQMRKKELVFIDIPFEKRLLYIVQGYGKLDRSLLLAAISRLQKKMGGLETKNAISYLLDDDVMGCFAILLKYYDKLYVKALEKKKNDLTLFEILTSDDVLPARIAGQLIETYGHK